MTRIAFLALLLSFPVSGLAQWSAEVPLSAPTLGPAALGQNSPAAASDGESWYATWTHVTAANETRIAGLLVRSDGSLASPLPTLLSDGLKEEHPTVIWNGSRYLVIWRSSYTEVKGQWVSREGEPIGAVITLMVGYFGEPDAATNGREILITGQYGGGVILRPDGSSLLLSEEKFGFNLQGVASDGDSFLVYGRVPGVGDNLGWARVSSFGSILYTQKGLPLLGTDVVWTGTEYVIAGLSGPGPTSQPTLLRISGEGQPVGEPIQASTDRVHSRVTLAPSGAGGLLAVWKVYVETLDGPTRIASIAPGGQISILPLAFEGFAPYLAPANGSVLMLWTSPDAIRHQRLSPGGAPLDEPRVTSFSSRDQTRPAVAATSAGFLAAWEERGELPHGGIPRVVVGPLRPRPSSLRSAVAQSEHGETSPSIASSGDVALVAWLQNEYPGRDHAMVQRFSPAGAPLDTDAMELGKLGVPRSPTASRLAVFWSGKYFFVAWSAEEGLQYKRVTREGIVLDPEPIRIPQSERMSGSTDPRALAQLEPHFAAAGDRILLVWQSSMRTGGCIITCPAPPPYPRVEAVRLDPEGMLLDSVPMVLSSGGGWGQVFPRVASNGDGYLVVWEDLGRTAGVAVSREGAVEPRNVSAEGFVEGLIATGDDYFLLTRQDGNRLIGYTVSPEGSLGSPGMSFGEVWSGSQFEPTPSTAMAVREDGTLVVLFTRTEEHLGIVRRIVYRHLGSLFESRRRIVGQRPGESSTSTRIR
jgi:hypothetical protein